MGCLHFFIKFPSRSVVAALSSESCCRSLGAVSRHCNSCRSTNINSNALEKQKEGRIPFPPTYKHFHHIPSPPERQEPPHKSGSFRKKISDIFSASTDPKRSAPIYFWRTIAWYFSTRSRWSFADSRAARRIALFCFEEPNNSLRRISFACRFS